jgi:hypothetical protein
VRVSCEKKAPIAVETCGSQWHEIRCSEVCDNPSDNRYRGEDTLRRNRRLRQLAFLCRLRAIANQTLTSYYFSHAFKTNIAARKITSIYGCAISALSSFGVDNKDWTQFIFLLSRGLFFIQIVFIFLRSSTRLRSRWRLPWLVIHFARAR